ESGQESSARDLPDLDRPVVTPTDQDSTVGREGRRLSWVRMPHELPKQFARAQIPKGDGLPESTARQNLAVGRDRNEAAPALRPLEAPQQPVAPRVPELHAPIAEIGDPTGGTGCKRGPIRGDGDGREESHAVLEVESQT